MQAEAISIPSQRPRRLRRLWVLVLSLVLVLILGSMVNLRVLWPWMSGWGATKEERERSLPGDDLIPTPILQTTKGLTIKAKPEAVYPWLLQLGVDRGGMYSYAWLENLLGLKVREVDQIVPELQNAKAGDFWRFTPSEYPLNPGPGLYVRELQPNKAVVLCFGMENRPEEACVDTWQFVLEPRADGATRLLLRSRMAIQQQMAIKLTYFAQFIMERRMLLEIRQRAEGLQIKDGR